MNKWGVGVTFLLAATSVMAKDIQLLEKARLDGKNPSEICEEYRSVIEKFEEIKKIDVANTGIGSVVYANKPGDGSAREQAASCQKVLGGWANIALEYATKRYRSNLINWGMLPFITEGISLSTGDYIFVPGIREAVKNKSDIITAYVLNSGNLNKVELTLKDLTDDERDIILSGCLINYYA